MSRGGQYTMGISTPYPWYIDPHTNWKDLSKQVNLCLYRESQRNQSIIDQVRIVMSRLKLKVNNCLLNNKDFFKLFNSIFNKIGYNCFIIFQDYINIQITIGRGVDIPWVGGWYSMGRGWYTIGRGSKFSKKKLKFKSFKKFENLKIKKNI
jgi:hypothetical protein